MITGPIVFIVSITGAIYAFQEEILDLTQEFRYVQTSNKEALPPSDLIAKANVKNPNKHVHAVMYHSGDRSAKVIYYSFEEEYYDFVYINPYNGEVLEVFDVKNSFFGWILSGHFNLWLPHEIGVPIIATSTFIFLLIIVSGLFLWWPRNKNNKKQKFRIKWNAKWRRKNYDLHSVFGFYAMIFALLFATTGLMWGFHWFRDSVYAVASGGDKFVEYYEPTSLIATNIQAPGIDRAWGEMNERYPNAEWIEVHIPHDSIHCIAANANPDASTYWKTDYLYFDQQTLETKPVDHQYGRLDDANFANTVMRMNYDIHVGGILGLPGKILMCLFSLTIASLPITGFLIWYGRKYKIRTNN
jgi:uncharacterized iron-regulated membrane protein